MDYLVVVLSVLTLIVLLYCAYKIRKIHLQGFSLIYNAEFAKREFGVLYSQLQDMFRLDKLLHLELPLPAMREWAGSPDFLFRVAEEVARRKPSVVVECSSGVSTLVISRMLCKQGFGHLYSLEDSPLYAEKSREILRQHNLSDWATILDAPLTLDQSETPWYSLKKLPDAVLNIDMLVVDGPVGANREQARFPALPVLYQRLNKKCLIILDDADRKDEKEIVRRWAKSYPEFEVCHIPMEKGMTMMER